MTRASYGCSFPGFVCFVVGDQLFACQIIEERAVLFLIGEVAGNGQYLPVKMALVSVDRFTVLKKSLEFSIDDDRKRVTQLNQLLIVMENRIRLSDSGLRIDFFVVRVYVDPWSTVCEACVLESSHCIGVRALSRLISLR